MNREHAIAGEQPRERLLAATLTASSLTARSVSVS
jgi:hypothetical protein